MIAVYLLRENQPFQQIDKKAALEWVECGVAWWIGKSAIRLKRARGSLEPVLRPDLSVRMPPSENRVAPGRGYPLATR